MVYMQQLLLTLLFRDADFQDLIKQTNLYYKGEDDKYMNPDDKFLEINFKLLTVIVPPEAFENISSDEVLRQRIRYINYCLFIYIATAKVAKKLYTEVRTVKSKLHKGVIFEIVYASDNYVDDDHNMNLITFRALSNGVIMGKYDYNKISFSPVSCDSKLNPAGSSFLEESVLVQGYVANKITNKCIMNFTQVLRYLSEIKLSTIVDLMDAVISD